MMACDYYQLLQITSAATFDEVHKAYRSLALQYHPDRNPRPDAAATMVLLNEAYAVLSEPSRRREYDATRLKTEPFDVAGPILRAAYDTLLKQGWTVAEANASSVILEQGQRVVRVIFTARLDNVLMKKIGRHFAGFCVVMAVEIETPINLAFHTVVIDLMRSSQTGPPFPDDCYRHLFAPFISL